MTAQFTAEAAPTGEFVRQPNRFTDRLTDPEPDRYVLYVSLACPWAHRSVIVRRLLGLEDALALRVVDPLRDERGWRFTLDEGDTDPVTGAAFVTDLDRESDPAFDGRATVPFVYDTVDRRIVTNDYPQITLDLATAWTPLHAPGAPDRGQLTEADVRLFTTLARFDAAHHGHFTCNRSTLTAPGPRPGPPR